MKSGPALDILLLRLAAPLEESAQNRCGSAAKRPSAQDRVAPGSKVCDYAGGRKQPGFRIPSLLGKPCVAN